MKKTIPIVAFLLFVVGTGGGVYFFRKAQESAGDLVKTEVRLNEVKKAFEERGRLLDGLKNNYDNAESQSRQMERKFSEASVQLESYQAEKLKIADMLAGRKTLEDRVIQAESLLTANRKAAESNEVVTQKKLEEMQQKIADAKLLDKQLKHANKSIEKLNMDVSAAQAELKSQKDLLKAKLTIVGEFESLGLSPDQIRSLKAENTRLKAVVALKTDPLAPKSILKETPQRILRTLPLGLGLPSADKRLGKPLKPDTIPKNVQP